VDKNKLQKSMAARRLPWQATCGTNKDSIKTNCMLQDMKIAGGVIADNSYSGNTQHQMAR
jgi:hypothetical protein